MSTPGKSVASSKKLVEQKSSMLSHVFSASAGMAGNFAGDCENTLLGEDGRSPPAGILLGESRVVAGERVALRRGADARGRRDPELVISPRTLVELGRSRRGRFRLRLTGDPSSTEGKMDGKVESWNMSKSATPDASTSKPKSYTEGSK